MKKHIIIILLASLLLLCACQPTPEKKIVIQKDFDQMIEKAKETPVADTVTLEGSTPELYAPTETPQTAQSPSREHVTDSFTGRTEAFKVIVDADVIRPDGPLPVVRVKPDEFNAVKAQPYFDVLCKGEDFYTYDELETKENLEKQIEYYQYQVDNNIPDLIEATEEERKQEVRHFKSLIKELKERWKTAKEKAENPVRNLSDVDWEKTPFYLAWGVYTTDEEVDFIFRPDSRVEQNGQIVQSIESSVYYSNQRRIPKTVSGSYWRYADVTGQRTVPIGTNLKKTPVEAQAEAEKVVAEIGLCDMAVDRVYLLQEEVRSEGREGYNINRQLPVDYVYQYVYEIRFCRVFREIPVCMPSNFASASIHSETEYAPSWRYEQLNVTISDDGVCSFAYAAPIEITETLVDDAALLPFSDIMGIARKMLPIIHEEEVVNSDQIENLTYRIDRIELRLQRIAERDNLQYGLLVPTWTFWGSDLSTCYDGSTLNNHACGGYGAPCGYLPLLCINAIDGTIIDPLLGY